MKVNSEAAAGAKLVGALFELLIPANQVDVVVGDWAEGWSKSPLGRRECRRPSSGTASLLSDRQRGWLQDILDNVGAIKRHLDHLAAPDFDSFQSDELVVDAVERCFSRISAAVKLGDKAEAEIPGLPWNDIRGLGLASL